MSGKPLAWVGKTLRELREEDQFGNSTGAFDLPPAEDGYGLSVIGIPDPVDYWLAQMEEEHRIAEEERYGKPGEARNG